MMNDKFFRNSLIIIGLMLLILFSSIDFVTSDENPEETEPYLYYYAPDNSFGMTTCKFVNWTYFKEYFTDNTFWKLEYKRFSYSEWTDGNQYFGVQKTWNDDGYWKINLTLNAPVDIYSGRFTFACNLTVLDYINKSDYEIWLTLPADATNNYTVLFNWSDIAQIEGLEITKGILNNYFWFRFKKDNIPSGYYIFDPTFGYASIGLSNIDIEDQISGGYFQISEAGTGDSITAYLVETGSGTMTVKCALYDEDENYVANSVTEETEVSGAGGWYEMDFLSSPTLNKDDWYYIVVWGEERGGSTTGTLRYNTAGGSGVYYDVETYGMFPISFSADVQSASGIASIYCTYTADAEEPPNRPVNFSYEIPTNNSYENSINTNFNVTMTDDDGDTFNWTIQCNNSDSSSGNDETNGSKSLTLSTLAYYTTYTIWVNATDNDTYYNRAIYNFTTENETFIDNWNVNFSNENPLNNSYENYIELDWNITMTDDDNNTFNWTIQCSNGNSSSGNNENNGSKLLNITGLEWITTYTVWVNATDDDVNWTREIFYFTTCNTTVQPLDPIGDGEWRLVSIPFNGTVLHVDCNIVNDTNNYTWTQAVDNGIIVNWVYNWSRPLQQWTFDDCFLPYYGYWMYFHETDYELVYFNVSVVSNATEIDENDWLFIAGLELEETTIGILFLIVLMFLAERKEDAIFYLFVGILALPLGVYLCGQLTQAFDTFLGVVCILLSLYYFYLFLYHALKFGAGRSKR